MARENAPGGSGRGALAAGRFIETVRYLSRATGKMPWDCGITHGRKLYPAPSYSSLNTLANSNDGTCASLFQRLHQVQEAGLGIGARRAVLCGLLRHFICLAGMTIESVEREGQLWPVCERLAVTNQSQLGNYWDILPRMKKRR